MAEAELKWKSTALLAIVMQIVREHNPLERDVGLFRRPFYAADKPKPASKGSAGAELVNGLMIKDGDYKLMKIRCSAFFNTHLHSYLQGTGFNQLVITANLLDMKNIEVAMPTLEEWCKSDN